jgi:hypothetical protein
MHKQYLVRHFAAPGSFITYYDQNMLSFCFLQAKSFGSPGKALLPSSTAPKQQQGQHTSGRPRPPQGPKQALQQQQKQRGGRLGLAQPTQKVSHQSCLHWS